MSTVQPLFRPMVRITEVNLKSAAKRIPVLISGSASYLGLLVLPRLQIEKKGGNSVATCVETSEWKPKAAPKLTTASPWCCCHSNAWASTIMAWAVTMAAVTLAAPHLQLIPFCGALETPCFAVTAAVTPGHARADRAPRRGANNVNQFVPVARTVRTRAFSVAAVLNVATALATKVVATPPAP